LTTIGIYFSLSPEDATREFLNKVRMMSEETFWGWPEFKAEIAKMTSGQERYFKSILPLLKKGDEIVAKIVNHPLSYLGKRPQDFVVTSLVTRCFRLSIIALHSALGGYHDTVPVLLRPSYEIGLRLLQIQREPIPASLGYLLGGTKEEIRIAESWLKYLRNSRQPTGNLEHNIKSLKAYVKIIRKELESHGYSPDEVEKKYGKLSPQRVAKEFGIEEHFYDISFGFMSGYVHERGFALDNYYRHIPKRRVYHTGPIVKNPGSVVDVFIDLFRNLHMTEEIIGEPKLAEQALTAYKNISKTFPMR